MAKVLTNSTSLADSAIGPLAVQSQTVAEFDVDDFTHSTVRAQALLLQTKNAAANADPSLAKDRPPVNLEGITAGGF